MLTSFQEQLTGPVDTSVNASVYVIQGSQGTQPVVQSLHALQRKVVCFIVVGAVQDGSSLASQLPARVIGEPVRSAPGWHYVDVRDPAVEEGVGRQLDQCQANGFDGVQGSVTDEYQHDTGFSISIADETNFLQWFAHGVHYRDMAATLEDTQVLAPSLADRFDMALVNHCVGSNTCGQYTSFVKVSKPVVDIEFGGDWTNYCGQASALGITVINKHPSLNAWQKTCAQHAADQPGSGLPKQAAPDAVLPDEPGLVAADPDAVAPTDPAVLPEAAPAPVSPSAPAPTSPAPPAPAPQTTVDPATPQVILAPSPPAPTTTLPLTTA
jgi:hypothetical protein